MADVISQVEINGVLYDVKDPEIKEWARAETKPTYTAQEIAQMAMEGGAATGQNTDEIVVLSSSNTLEASGETLSNIYSRIDQATVVDTVADHEWVINIVNDDGEVDFGHYYTTETIDQKLDEKVNKDGDKELTDNNFTDELLTKLNSVEFGANNYNDADVVQLKSDAATLRRDVDAIVVPDELSDLASDEAHRTVTDAQIAAWNAKYDLGIGVTENELAPSLKQKLAGIIPLTPSGKIPSSYLPEDLEDVVVGTELTWPKIGDGRTIYIDQNTNTAYRWSGTKYVQINGGVVLGTGSNNAFYGNLGQEAYNHSRSTGNPHGTTLGDLGLSKDVITEVLNSGAGAEGSTKPTGQILELLGEDEDGNLTYNGNPISGGEPELTEEDVADITNIFSIEEGGN